MILIFGSSFFKLGENGSTIFQRSVLDRNTASHIIWLKSEEAAAEGMLLEIGDMDESVSSTAGHLDEYKVAISNRDQLIKR